MKVKFIFFLLISIATFSQQKGNITLLCSEKSELSFGSYKYNIPQIKSEIFWNTQVCNKKNGLYVNQQFQRPIEGGEFIYQTYEIEYIVANNTFCLYRLSKLVYFGIRTDYTLIDSY